MLKSYQSGSVVGILENCLWNSLCWNYFKCEVSFALLPISGSEGSEERNWKLNNLDSLLSPSLGRRGQISVRRNPAFISCLSFQKSLRLAWSTDDKESGKITETGGNQFFVTFLQIESGPWAYWRNISKNPSLKSCRSHCSNFYNGLI